MSSPESSVPAQTVRRYRERVFAERDRLLAAQRDTAEHQRLVLADLLAHNADTAFGRAHDFARIRTLDEYRRAVPIRDYAGLEPWIERGAAGERRVLSSDDPVLYFTSSGSTGAHKKVPITARFMRTSFFPFFYAAWAPMAEHFPELIDRRDTVLNLKHDPRPVVATTAAGHPHLGASQVDFGTVFGEPMSAEPGTAAPWASTPSFADPADHLDKVYLRLRRAVEGADVRCVIGINPAMVAALPYQLRMWWSDIVREIHDGTLGGRPYGPGNPARARELDELASRFPVVRPAHVWPRMKALFCWTTGLAGLYLPRLREEFGVGVTVLPAPVAASEGPVGVALDRHGSAGGLVVTAAAYEFLDADTPVTPDAETLRPHELEPGREYHVVFSHVGGLYRYSVGDVVRVVDFANGAPRVAYAGRDTVVDRHGERLRESQVIRAIAAALDGGGLEARNAACHAPADGGRYEFAIATDLPWTRTEGDDLAGRLDAVLSRESGGYRAARAAGRLGTPVVRRLDGEAFLRDWHERVRAGVRPAQVKDRVWYLDPPTWQALVGSAEHIDEESHV
ncbi:GH3 auxin-responsive promoter family protein [Micromonospora sp. KC207]|uniref:GH3 auxin-responsive promoter family protein n=1 Tax=Micromonospora sp. KC207 TaxID=2530377 RepID=UPI0010475450|nr:GH3 auxin-responsive promoter family protein [Micromonospora sp. KC207]TDC52890.1 GH3 auxin-responsive promoter family protein [Micromonospora sp. KC207]